MASTAWAETADLLRIRLPALAVIPAVRGYDGVARWVVAMAVISLKLTEALDAQLTAQAQRRRLSKSELVRRNLKEDE